MVQNTFSYLEPFRRGSSLWRTDERTDGLCDSKCRTSLCCAAKNR